MDNAKIAKEVKRFYANLPFNYAESIKAAHEVVKNQNPIHYYTNLKELFNNNQIHTVLDAGCGAGWFVASAAYYYQVKVAGFDFTQKAIDQALALCDSLGVSENVDIRVDDIFEYKNSHLFDLVNCIGVLPCIESCKEAFVRLSHFIKPGKFIHLGLYHSYGRKVFIEILQGKMRAGGEEAAFQMFKELNPQIKDPVRLKSWFRDQVLHPFEVWHTLEEVLDWLDEAGLSLVNTSINRFKPIDDLKELCELEKEYEQISYQKNQKEGIFFPGFFTILCKKNSPS